MLEPAPQLAVRIAGATSLPESSELAAWLEPASEELPPPEHTDRVRIRGDEARLRVSGPGPWELRLVAIQPDPELGWIVSAPLVERPPLRYSPGMPPVEIELAPGAVERALVEARAALE